MRKVARSKQQHGRSIPKMEMALIKMIKMDVIEIFAGKGPANNTEACLQHEISRLTGENFDLREKIEVLQDHKKQLKLMLKTYRKKLAEAGEQVPDLSQGKQRPLKY